MMCLSHVYDKPTADMSSEPENKHMYAKKRHYIRYGRIAALALIS